MNHGNTLALEAERIITRLKEADPLSIEYGYGLGNLEHLLGIKQFVVESLLDCAPVGEAPKAAPVVELHPVENPFPEPAPEPAPEAEPETKYSKEEVRAALAKARKEKGINVTELLKEFGVDSFPAFPEGKYGELMARLV